MVGERGQNACAVLAGRAVNEHRPLRVSQRPKVSREQVDVAGLERRHAIILEQIAAERGFAEIGFADVNVPGIGLVVAQIVVDQHARKALMPQRGVAEPLALAPQIDDHRQVQRRDGRQVVLRRPAVRGGPIEPPGFQAPAPGRRIVAVVAKVIDALEGQMSGHAQSVSGGRRRLRDARGKTEEVTDEVIIAPVGALAEGVVRQPPAGRRPGAR